MNETSTSKSLLPADAWQSVIRSLLKIGGGYFVARGLADESTVEAICAALAALLGIVWGMRHRAPAPAPGPSLRGRVPLFIFVLAGFFLLVGCASHNLKAFRAEDVLSSKAAASVSAWNAFVRSGGATNTARHLQIHAAARALSARLALADDLRERALTNGVSWSEVEATLQGAAAECSNVLWLVEKGMNNE